MSSEIKEKVELSAEEIERKKKKEEKAREKELKRLKAKQKEEEAKAKLAQQASGASKVSKKKILKKGSEEENPDDYVDPETLLGEKKRLSWQMAKHYNPKVVEKAWYPWWEKSCFFEADSSSSKPPFVIVFPPPNVTGAFILGMPLPQLSRIQLFDGVECQATMSFGYGMDHAGIATQRKKPCERRKKLDMTWAVSYSYLKVWDWKNKHGGTIMKQLRCLGASLDWSRECFTMDERRSKAVSEAFVSLYKEGLIYRAKRLVNWDCILRTAISDFEVDFLDIKERTELKVPGYDKPVEFGVLTSFAYPLEGGLGEIVVVTTRIETMLGDTAIAIHPNDPRYKHLHGFFALILSMEETSYCLRRDSRRS